MRKSIISNKYVDLERKVFDGKAFIVVSENEAEIRVRILTKSKKLEMYIPRKSFLKDMYDDKKKGAVPRFEYLGC